MSPKLQVCARKECSHSFERSSKRGRPQKYCSEECAIASKKARGAIYTQRWRENQRRKWGETGKKIWQRFEKWLFLHHEFVAKYFPHLSTSEVMNNWGDNPSAFDELAQQEIIKLGTLTLKRDPDARMLANSLQQVLSQRPLRDANDYWNVILEHLVADLGEPLPPPPHNQALVAPSWINPSIRLERERYQRLFRAYRRINEFAKIAQTALELSNFISAYPVKFSFQAPMQEALELNAFAHQLIEIGKVSRNAQERRIATLISTQCTIARIQLGIRQGQPDSVKKYIVEMIKKASDESGTESARLEALRIAVASYCALQKYKPGASPTTTLDKYLADYEALMEASPEAAKAHKFGHLRVQIQLLLLSDCEGKKDDTNEKVELFIRHLSQNLSVYQWRELRNMFPVNRWPALEKQLTTLHPQYANVRGTMPYFSSEPELAAYTFRWKERSKTYST